MEKRTGKIYNFLANGEAFKSLYIAAYHTSQKVDFPRISSPKNQQMMPNKSRIVQHRLPFGKLT